MRIGLLGGTFNPIHNCHLTIARETRDRLRLNRVVFVPSGDPPHKPAGSLAPAAHRQEMVNLAIEGEPTFELSDVELLRPGKSYTIDTIRALQKTFSPSAELFFILGLDSFLDFPTWRNAPELLKLCHFVVVSRSGASFASLSGLAHLPALEPARLESLDAGQDDRWEGPLSENTRLILLRIPPCTASASDIRRRVMAGQSLSSMLPARVESYIIRLGLFREDNDHTRE